MTALQIRKFFRGPRGYDHTGSRERPGCQKTAEQGAAHVPVSDESYFFLFHQGLKTHKNYASVIFDEWYAAERQFPSACLMKIRVNRNHSSNGSDPDFPTSCSLPVITAVFP